AVEAHFRRRHLQRQRRLVPGPGPGGGGAPDGDSQSDREGCERRGRVSHLPGPRQGIGKSDHDKWQMKDDKITNPRYLRFHLSFVIFHLPSLMSFTTTTSGFPTAGSSKRSTRAMPARETE